MTHPLVKRARGAVFCLCGLFVVLLLTACEGIATTTTANGTQYTLTGQVQSVNRQNRSLTLSVSGQSLTVNNLTDTQISQLQNQVGKKYTIIATRNADGSYTIVLGTNPVVSSDNTPVGISSPTPAPTSNTDTTSNAGPPVQGKITFVGKVQSLSASQLVATLPSGDSLTIDINATTSNTLGGQTASGQSIFIEALTNPDGTLVARTLDVADQSEQNDPNVSNEVDFTGFTTSPVGSDHVIHFKVGTNVYSAALVVGTTDLRHTKGIQSLTANMRVKVNVLYNGTNATALKVEAVDTFD